MGKGSKLKTKAQRKPHTHRQSASSVRASQEQLAQGASPVSATEAHSAPHPSPSQGAEAASTDSPAAQGLTEELHLAPLWRRQPLVSLFVALFLMAQLLLPLSYYLGEHPWDERFSWRMFSTVRGLSCEPRLWRGALEGERARPCPNAQGACVERSLSQALHMVWVNLLKRGRLEVLNALVERACAAEPTRPLYMSLRCPHPEPPHPWVELQSPLRDLCSDTSKAVKTSQAELNDPRKAQQSAQPLTSEVSP